MSTLLAGLAPRGQLIVVGVGDDPIEVNGADLVFGSRSIVGSLTGSTMENEASLQFSATHKVAPMTEVLPFEQAPAAYERMMSGQARFRVALDMQASSQMGTER
jgi:D-arabinose 1-dehydrogenase-like Zn-dependent alcohol dehydrogenase